MTKEEKERFTKAKRTVDRNRQYKSVAEDPDAHARLQAKRKQKREEQRAQETEAQAEERRKKWRDRMNEYNQNLRETDPEKYRAQWMRSNAARSSSSPQYKECPKCTVMIEHTGGCELISCPCGMHFSFKYPEIHGEDKDLVAENIKRNRTNRWMKKDRQENPEVYRERDRAKFAQLMEDPERAEKERERQRLKAKRARENADPEQASAYNRERREIKRQRLTDGFKKCPACNEVHQSKTYEMCRTCRKDARARGKKTEGRDIQVEEWNCTEDEKLWYLSGLFEADGCVKVNKVKNQRNGVEHINHCIEMQLLSETRDLAEAFTLIGGKVYETKGGHFEWRATGQDAMNAAIKLSRGTTEKAAQMNEIKKFPMGRKGNTPELREFKQNALPVREKIRETITAMKRDGCGMDFSFPDCTEGQKEAFIAGFVDGDGWTTISTVGVLQKRGKIVHWLHSLYGGDVRSVYKTIRGRKYGPYEELVIPKDRMRGVLKKTRLDSKK